MESIRNQLANPHSHNNNQATQDNANNKTQTLRERVSVQLHKQKQLTQKIEGLSCPEIG
jgi:hypothetical protein